MVASLTRRVTALLQRYDWNIEYFKGFILGLVWLGLYRRESRYEAFLDIETGSLSKADNQLLDDYAAELVSSILAGRYRFSPGCRVDTSLFESNYKKASRLFQWASGVYMACRIMDVMVEDGDLAPEELDGYIMDRIAEAAFPFLDKNFAEEFFTEVVASRLSSEECMDLLVKLRGDLPQTIRDITAASQAAREDDQRIADTDNNALPRIDGPILSVHGFLAGITDSKAINDWVDHLLPVVMGGDRKRRVLQLEHLLQYAEKALGKEFFMEHRGKFWLISETRPYLRTLVALAEAYKVVFKREQAVTCYEKSLRLCESDNLGCRYLLAELYLELQYIDKAIELIGAYEDDESAMFGFTYVAALFAKYGDSGKALNALKQAHKSNPHVVDFLLGKVVLPERFPEYYAPGDIDEAIIYVGSNQLLWRNISGLIEWLNRCRGSL